MNSTTSKLPGIFRCLASAVIVINTTLASWAQSAVSASGQSRTDDPVALSAFTVTSTQDKGYITSNSGSAFRTNERIMDIPQTIQVVTRDMIDDIGAFNASDILIYAGVVSRFQGEAMSLRGAGLGYPLIDGMIDRSWRMDSMYVDSYEVIRGPAAVFYPNSGLSGVINKSIRKPLPQSANSVGFRISQWGLYRTELDSTGPFAHVGEGVFAYRVLAAYQDGDDYYTNMQDRRIVFHPSLRFKNKNTTVDLGLDYVLHTGPSNGTAVLTPDGKIYTGAGRKNILYLPSTAAQDSEHRGARLQLTHVFSPEWELRIGADANKFKIDGSIVLPVGGVNYVNRTISFFNRHNFQDLEHYSLALDVNGKYEILGLKNQSTFGMNLTRQEDISQFWVNPDFGVNQRIVRSLDNPDIETLPVKPYDQYVTPANPGSRTRTDFGNFFYQHRLDLIQDRLSLVAGASIYSNNTINIKDISIRPVEAVSSNLVVQLYRYGFVYHITKDIALYGLDANTSLPPSTFRLQDGSTVPPAFAKGKEVGMKIDFFDGKISGTVAAFKNRIGGGTQPGGFLPSGDSYVVRIADRTQEGFDLDLALRVTPNWQIIANAYKGEVLFPDGKQVSATYRGSWSFFTRYDFHRTGWSVGGGVSLVTGQIHNTGPIVFPAGQINPGYIETDEKAVTTAFINYVVNNKLSIRLSVENLTDAIYPAGISSPTGVNPALPRTFSLSVRRKL